MEIKEFEMELLVTKEMFYSDESMFGIYGCKPVHYTTEIQLNRFNNFSLQGETRRLKEGDTYVIKFDGTYPNKNPRFDDFYKIVEVEADRLDSVENQDKFLQAITTEKQFESLKEAYPDPNLLVDLILEDKIDTRKTKGIKKKTLAKIKSDVEKNAHISILIAKLNTLNLSTKSIDKLLKHFTTSEAVVEAIEENLFNLCKVSGFGFLTIDKVFLGMGHNPTDRKRIVACINYLLEKNADDGHTWCHTNELVDEALELLQINKTIIEDNLEGLKSSPRFYISDKRVALQRIKEEEESILKHLWRIHSAYIKPSKTRVENKIPFVEEWQGFDFTEEQKRAIIESSQCGVSVINGFAGSGKTAIVKGLIETLGVTDGYMTATLSGKAANVLSTRGLRSSTIHRMLKYDGKGFLYDDVNPLPFEIIVLDELSMVDTSLFLKVLEAIPTGGKLILVGDSAQLSSVSYGDILRDLLETRIFPTFNLSQVHRQSAESGVLSLANKVRRGESITTYNSSGKEVFGEGEDQSLITYSKDNKDSIPYDVLRIAQSYKSKMKSLEELLDFQVLVSNRASGSLSSVRMNIELQKIFNDIDKPFISRNGFDFRSLDKVISVGNNYKLKAYKSIEEYEEDMRNIALMSKEDEDELPQGNTDIFNGSMGIIRHIHHESKVVFVEFEGVEGLIPYAQSNLDKLSLGYCITVHRSQGSSFPFLLYALDYSSYMLLNRKIVYTALTRSSHKGIILAENNALLQAVKNEGNERRTFLREYLLKSVDN